MQFFNNLVDFIFVLASAHVEIQHRMLIPVLFQRSDGQAFKKVFSALEVILQRAAK